MYEARANTGVDRMEIIDAVAKLIPAPHKVDLSNPDKTIIVEIARVSKAEFQLKYVACMYIIPILPCISPEQQPFFEVLSCCARLFPFFSNRLLLHFRVHFCPRQIIHPVIIWNYAFSWLFNFFNYKIPIGKKPICQKVCFTASTLALAGESLTSCFSSMVDFVIFPFLPT